MKFSRLILLSVILIFLFKKANGDNPPSQPLLVSPSNNANNVSTNANLIVNVSDPEGSPLTVKYFVRLCNPPAAPADFTIVGLPDTQYYTGLLHGGTNEMFKSQMNWILNNRISQNIVFMEGLGDCVENGDNVVNEWKRVDTCMKIIENPVTTNLVNGIPYGINVGNHDQTPAGSAGGTTLFNTYFGFTRFNGRAYYGGHYGSNNNNNYNLFSVGNMDFIVINLEFSSSMSAGLISWMQNLLSTYSNRRAIIGSHTMISAAGIFGAQGQTIYNAVKNYPNVFLMLCGHVVEEAMRRDTFNGNVITTVLSDYQGRTNGGNGWMRLMKFSPLTNTVSVKTYSPWLNQYETDANSQFSISYNMNPANFTLLGSLTNASGKTFSLPWDNLLPNTCYQWYVTVSDGNSTITSPTWSFTTANSVSPVTVNLKTFIGGFYRNSGTMTATLGSSICDSVTLELRNTVSPYSLAQSKRLPINTTGNGSFPFSSDAFGKSYYLVVKHRNSLETWSAFPVLLNGTSISYDFTTSQSKAYGNNLMDLKDGRYAIFSGDVNQNGQIDTVDFSLVENASHLFISGYNVYDLTGDNIIESADYSFLENNINTTIYLIKP